MFILKGLLFLIKLVIGIILLPVFLVLWIFLGLLKLIVSISKYLLFGFSVILVIIGAILFFALELGAGLAIGIFGLLLSPIGLPLIASALINVVEWIINKIKDLVY